MADILGMQVNLQTSLDSDSQTDDEIYIGLWGTGGGREFPLSSSTIDDFERGTFITYVLGEAPIPQPPTFVRSDRAKPGEANDPAGLQIDLASVQYVYIRKQAYGRKGDDNAYKLRSVVVFMYATPGTGGRIFTLQPPRELWLANEHGHQAWLEDSGRVAGGVQVSEAVTTL
ncbi:hypothetical protein [Rhodococcus chondri]|uniref:Uncharacterized protein n=1 Tax=Rhodococcus chondri TaxID=3065941 RepID=A0ABU7JR85_9NOCA|nr:hypothetical protein [Rhodococcus sp. CC-R104]MEE2032533.1 hypothetical protein [Rhodococcus sp. CC-R104]